MSVWLRLLIIFGSIAALKCELRLIISQYLNDVYKPISSSNLDISAGLDLYLKCEIGGSGIFSTPDLRWGKKNQNFRFNNESDLIKLAKDNNKYMSDLNNELQLYYYTYFDISHAYLQFNNIEMFEKGTYFCMSLKYMLFKIIHIRVKDEYLDGENSSLSASECSTDKFRCVMSGYCIGLHYMCDGKPDCRDRSDEKRKLCNGNPCRDKIRCADGRCIPISWCCDKNFDKDCNVTIRPACCPPLINLLAYDPLHYYNEKDINSTKTVQQHSSTSKYLFITICVVSAILSFVVFLFVISKICGFENKPISRRNEYNTRCEHSGCVIRRELDTNVRCLYQTNIDAAQNLTNNNLDDPLILIMNNESDQPPSYAEVVNSPANIYKCALNTLIDDLPPPYSNMKFFKTDAINANNNRASENNNSHNNQNESCDINDASNYSNNGS